MTPLHQAAQMALDALLIGYHRGTHDAIAALREALAQPVPEPVALESVHLTRDTRGMCVVRVNGRLAIRDNGDIIDHMATLEWFATPPAPQANPDMDSDDVLWLWKDGEHFLAYRHLYPCYSPGGDPMTLGEPFGKAIFRHSHDRSTSPGAAPPAPAAPARVPLTDEQIDKILERERMRWATSPPTYEFAAAFARAIEAAHGIGGSK